MKRIICILTLLCICCTAALAFAGCSSVTPDDLIAMIDSACSEETIGNTDYTLKAYGVSVTASDKISYELNYKTGDHKSAKFTIVDETDVKYTKYITSYYGACVPEGKYTDYWASFPDSLFNLEEATEEDYQDWYFYDTTLYYDAKAEQKTYYLSKQNDSQTSSTFTVKRNLQGGWEEFMALDKVSKCDIKSVTAVILSLKDYIDIVSTKVESKGRVDNFTVKITDECPVTYLGETLAGNKLTLSFTNGKVSTFELLGKFRISIAYGGAKIMMPHYDTAGYIDYASQIQA